MMMGRPANNISRMALGLGRKEAMWSPLSRFNLKNSKLHPFVVSKRLASSTTGTASSQEVDNSNNFVKATKLFERMPKAWTEEEVKAVTAKFFKLMGGPTHFKTTERTLLFTGFAAMLFSQHLFFINEDLFETLALSVAAVGVFNAAKKPIAAGYHEFIKSEHDRIRNKLTGTRNELAEKRDGLQAYKDIGLVNQSLIQMIRENIVNQGKILQLKQRNDFLASAKGQLEARARQDLERRDRQRRELLALVHERVLARIQTPQVQNQILAQCLKDLSELANKK